MEKQPTLDGAAHKDRDTHASCHEGLLRRAWLLSTSRRKLHVHKYGTHSTLVRNSARRQVILMTRGSGPGVEWR